jgi:hypothetical protein
MKPKTTIKYQHLLIALIIIIVSGIYFNKNLINEFPSHIHAWAQSDRYALALGFTNNNLDFFKPETFTLNHQFPDKWTTPTESSVTSVDFPIHDYIPAVIMKITNNRSPWIFRVYILLYSFLGLFFLFKLSFLITKSFLKSILTTLFAATSPIFIYYQSGFLPTIPSLSNAIIGVYFYSCYLKTCKNRDFILSLTFITLAALSRTTFAIPLIALFGVEFIRAISGEIKIKNIIIPAVFSATIILGYFFYNQYLRNEYGSIFLSHFLPPENLAHAAELIRITLQNWEFHYLTKAHYILITGIILTASIILFRKSSFISHFQLILVLFSVVMLTGCGLFAILMMQQFPAHDYYFLDSFFFPVLLIFATALSFIPLQNRITKSALFLMILIFAYFSVSDAGKIQKERRTTGSWDKTMATINNYEGAGSFLDSLNISDDARLLVIGANVPNIPFILANRKGYAVMSTHSENIEHALQWDFDYAVMQNQFIVPDIYSSYPAITNELDKIASNGKISVYRKENIPQEKTLIDFLGLNKKQAVYVDITGFEDEQSSKWSNIKPSKQFSYSGAYSSELTPGMTYGVTFKTDSLKYLVEKSRIILFKSMIYHHGINDCNLVASITEDGEQVYYQTYNLAKMLHEENKWEPVTLTFQLPRINSNNYEFGLYIWNTGKNHLYIDDISFNLY